jgi:hypothetical protein
MQHLEIEEKKEKDNKKETKMEMEEKGGKRKRKTPDKNLLKNWEVYYQESWTDDQIPQHQMQQVEAEKGRGQEEDKKQKEEEVCGFVLPQVEVAAGSSSSVEDTISK